MKSLLSILASASLAILGCSSSVSDDGSGGAGGSPQVDCDPPSSPATFEIGTGETCFSRLSSGQVVPLIQGPQGGFHLWVALSCTDCPAELHVRYGALDPMTGAHFDNGYPNEAILRLHGDGSWRHHGGLTAPMPGLTWDLENFPPLEKGAHVVLFLEELSGSTVTRRAEVEVELGDTVTWNPCEANPDAEYCGLDGGGTREP